MAAGKGSSNWAKQLQHVKFWRNEVKRLIDESSISNLEILSDLGGKPAILGLANMAAAPVSSDSGSPQQMLMYTAIPEMSDEGSKLLGLRPLITQTGFGANNNSQTTAELALFYERMRSQIVNGITSYSIHATTGHILLSSATQLAVSKDRESINPLAQYLTPSSAILNATFSPAFPEYVAFTSGGQLYIDRNNEKIFETDDFLQPNVTNGVAPFVTQEEFDRFEGFWWSPTRAEVLYERVDETPVTKLTFLLPGSQAESDSPMRYPLAGTPNAISTLRLCQLDSETNAAVDLELDAELKDVVSFELEYLVKCGWDADGEKFKLFYKSNNTTNYSVYIIVMDRVQSVTAILLVPRTLFVEPSKVTRSKANAQSIRIIYEERSRFWINTNNHLYFFATQPDGKIRAIIGSEKLNQSHLFLHTFDATNGSSTEVQLTSGNDWCVINDARPVVDPKRGLVYFLANRVSPLILSLCVTTVDQVQECRVLTPTNLTYRFESRQPTLSVNPDVGFVCWLTSVTQLPECHFYRFVHDDPATRLPTAVFAHRLLVHGQSPTSAVLSPPSQDSEGQQVARNLSSLFRHRFFNYRSDNSKQIHYALLLWPTEDPKPGSGGKYPVIHAVYAGPHVQLVRDSWHTVTQYLKFVSLGYAVILVDGRGSANRGAEFEGAIKEQFGSVEVEDQVEGLQFLAKQSGILDLGRVAVCGWSYGGFMSIMLIATHPELYRVCCAGGAVADWTLYDTCYTERYMGLPSTNEAAYKQHSLAPVVSKLPDEEGRVLVVHGMIDENVHFSHTTRLINAMIAAKKPHQLLLFPTERHAIRGADSIEYYHATMLSFFDRALQ